MLASDEYGTGMDLATKQHATVMPNLVNYKAFKSFMFQQKVIEKFEDTGLVEISGRSLESRNYYCCQPTVDYHSFICCS